MKLLALADIHGDTRHIPLLKEHADCCDAIVIAGDITNFGGREQAERVLEAIQCFQKPILAVPGNCDLTEVDESLQHRQANLHGSVIEVEKVAFVGVGGSLPCPGATPNEAGEGVFSEILTRAVSGHTDGNRLILVTHQPAWGIDLDRTGDGRHTGSRAIRQFIEERQPVLAVCGHMHEARGTDQLGKTTLVNPGPFRQGYFAIINVSTEQVQVQMMQL